MSRRKAATKREILPDSKYNNLVVAKCINVVMWDGKKEVAENIVYGALDKLKTLAKDGKDELSLFLEAVDALKPSVEVKGLFWEWRGIYPIREKEPGLCPIRSYCIFAPCNWLPFLILGSSESLLV